MQPLPTEAGPLSQCSRCGNAMPPPDGTATFVYGVGAVGYQNCTSCGARWRYLWQEPKAPARRANRRFFVVGALLAVAILGVVAAVALRSSPRKFGATGKPNTTASTETSAPVTSTSDPTSSSEVTTGPASTAPPAGFATGADYVRIIGPIAGAKAAFMDWLGGPARSTPQYEVNQRVSEFVKLMRDSTDALSREKYAEPAATDVGKLVRAYKTYIGDVDLIRYGLLYSASFSDRLSSDNQALRDATDVVRRDLGMP